MVRFGFATVLISGIPTLAVLSRDRVYALEDVVLHGPTAFIELFDRWHETIVEVERALDAQDNLPSVPAAAAAFAVPGVERPAIYCAGGNYYDHVKEMGAEAIDQAFHFISPPGVLNHHGGVVTRPTGRELLDWEVELAVVIGKTARHVSAANALDHVAGYAVTNDVSVRDQAMYHPLFGVDWMIAKNGDGMTPIGPAIVPTVFVPEPGALGLSLSVNGVLRQSSNTSQLIVDIPRQIEALSSIITLRPGDLILTGTPAGTAKAHDNAYLAEGDVMVARIEQVGELTNTIA